MKFLQSVKSNENLPSVGVPGFQGFVVQHAFDGIKFFSQTY